MYNILISEKRISDLLNIANELIEKIDQKRLSPELRELIEQFKHKEEQIKEQHQLVLSAQVMLDLYQNSKSRKTDEAELAKKYYTEYLKLQERLEKFNTALDDEEKEEAERATRIVKELTQVG